MKEPNPSQQHPLFLTTRWATVLHARDHGAMSSGRLALESLCQTYWYPLYVFVRRQGHSAHEAQDLTKVFFSGLLEKDYVRSVERGKCRFRTFLIIALKRFLLNEWHKLLAEKRRRIVIDLSLDSDLAESRYLNEALESLPADQMYERRWALTLMELSMSRLRSEYEGSGDIVEFELLKNSLTSERPDDVLYREIAVALQITESASRVALHRLRKRFREIFREEIAGTVSTIEGVEDELRHVVGVLSRN